jgi:hypothetical protein
LENRRGSWPWHMGVMKLHGHGEFWNDLKCTGRWTVVYSYLIFVSFSPISVLRVTLQHAGNARTPFYAQFSAWISTWNLVQKHWTKLDGQIWL